jgi:transposase
MSDAKPTKEALIVRLAGLGMSRDAICAQLGVGSHRVTNTLKGYNATGRVPEAVSRGPRKKLTKAILDFIDICTLQRAHLSNAKLVAEIKAKFHVNFHPATIAVQRHLAGFRYQPPRHTQELKDYHIEDRRNFAAKMLAHPSWLPKIHFSDESRFVLGDDKRWVWYRRGEYNPSAMRSTRKFPPAVMIFAVIGPNYKSKLLFVDGTINTDKYIQRDAETATPRNRKSKSGDCAARLYPRVLPRRARQATCTRQKPTQSARSGVTWRGLVSVARLSPLARQMWSDCWEGGREGRCSA